MAAPATQLVELTLRECLRALRSLPIGRLVYTEHALPAVRPVHFTVWDHSILIWSMPGTTAQTLRNDVVAFEALAHRPGYCADWHLPDMDAAASSSLERLANVVKVVSLGRSRRRGGRQRTARSPSSGCSSS